MPAIIAPFPIRGQMPPLTLEDTHQLLKDGQDDIVVRLGLPTGRVTKAQWRRADDVRRLTAIVREMRQKYGHSTVSHWINGAE